MFKKQTALILAFAMFISCISIDAGINLQTVFAGETIPSYTVSLYSSLSEGYTNGVPEFSNSNTDDTAALFSFSMENDPDSNSFVQGKYVLSYPLKDNTYLEMTVYKDSADSATVVYQVTNGAGANINLTETGGTKDFTIFSQKNGYTQHGSYNTYNGSVESGNYVVSKNKYSTTDPRDNGGTPNMPVFHMKKGYGYSFEYNGVYAHIKWDDITGNFQFYTDSLYNGNIYDVTLDYYDNVAADVTTTAPTASDTLGVFTGMSLSQGSYQGYGKIADDFIAAPFANEDTATGEPKHFSENVVYGGTTSSSGLIPGQQTNGIRFGFTVPKVWNSATNKYDTNISDADYDMNLKLYLGGLQIRINDILGSSINVASSSYTTEVVQPIDSNGQFYFDVKNLPPGVIYDNVTISPEILKDGTDKQAVNYKTSQSVPFGKVFTFPEYEVVQLNGKHYIKLKPFVTDTGTIRGTYLLKTDGTPSVVQNSEGLDTIYFPLPIGEGAAGENYRYQIFFNPLDTFSNVFDTSFRTHIHSEIYDYIVPLERGDISQPENFVVNDYTLTAIPGIDKEDEMNLSMDISYDVATEENLNKMLDDSENDGIPGDGINVTYSLSSYLKPVANDPSEVVFANLNLYIYRDDYTDEDGNIIPDTIMVEYTLTYPDGTEVASYSPKTAVPLPSTYRADADANVYYADITFDMFAGRVGGNPPDSPIYFEYPNIYFLTVNATDIDREGDGTYETALGGSTFESITLNDITNAEVPPPQDIQINNTTKKSFDVSWKLSGEGVRDYLLEIFTPTELSDIRGNIESNDANNNLNAYYNIYIGTNENYMKQEFSTYPLPDTENTGSPTRTSASYEINAESLADPYNISMSTYTDDEGNSYSANMGVGETTEPIDTLREDKGIVMISHFPIFNENLATGNYQTDTDDALQSVYNNRSNIDDLVSIYGLDKNQKYYVYADLVVESIGVDEAYVKSSLLSPLVGETTLSDIEVPDDKDKVPPSPVLRLEGTSVDNATIAWDPIVVKDENGKNSQIEYDIIRLESLQMPDEYLTTKDSFSYTWENYLPPNVRDKKGYRTNIVNESDNLLEYDEASKDFVSTDDAELDSSVIKLTDNGLVPNKVYFYYVRSVRVLTDENGNEQRVYSNWSRISATTSNIQSPTNLKINTDYETYDPFTEVVLNFDAPIIDTSKLGTSYDFYYQVRTDGGNWSEPILMDANTLKNNVVAVGDTTTNFNYKVSGLTAGTNYTFRVKMVDKTTGASSLYSNEARAKTDFDQTDYDDDDEINDWYDFIIDMLMEMINDPYWIINDSSGQKDIVYRQEKFPGLIAGTNDTFVTLVPADKGKTNNYYIPADSYEKLCNSNKGIKIIYDNVEYYISPKALNSQLSTIKSNVSSGNIKDYYIKISISGYASGSVNNEKTLSDIMTFSVVAQGFDSTIKNFEKEAYNELLELLVSNADIDKLMKEIEDYVEDGNSDLEIQSLVYDALPDIEEELLDEINDMFKDYLSNKKYSYGITKLDNPVNISLTGANSTTMVNGYYQSNGNWILKNTMTYGALRTISSYDTGVYTFTGQTLTLPGLDKLPYGDNIKNLFIKYGLGEYLGTGSTFNLDQSLTGYMVMGSCAKMMGMPSGGDPVAYLKNMGVNASERTSRTTIKSGDMIYYLMEVYQYKTGTNIENLNVTNYGATSGMTGITSQNKKSIQIATQIGLIGDPNFNANYEMKVGDFLYYLDRLSKIIAL